MDRRIFLRRAGYAGFAGLLAACGQPTSVPSTADPTAPGSSPTPGADDPVATVAPDAEKVLTLISASFEQLTGEGRPFAFGLVGPNNEPLTGADVDVWVVPAQGGQPAGPYPATFHEVPGQPLGVYLAEVDITEAGPTSFVAVTSDQRAGADAIQVASPADSQLPAPGREAMAVATPTNDDDLGFEQLCTADPPCGMHEVSLDQALEAGRPIMLTFATPAYCETAVCGPSVEILDEVRTSRDWGETVFIHVEIFTDGGQTVAEPVTEWGLPSEPWLFAIAADGTIVDRADGPLLTLSEQVAAMTAQVQ